MNRTVDEPENCPFANTEWLEMGDSTAELFVWCRMKEEKGECAWDGQCPLRRHGEIRILCKERP